MDDILQDSPDGANTQPVDLSDLVEVHPLSTNLPVPAVRNRAAMGAILDGDPNSMVEKYRLMMQEGLEGKDVTLQEVHNQIENQNRSKSMKYVMRILGDPSISVEQKRKIITFVQNDGLKEEPAATLQTNALSAPSKGENIRGESARISLSDTMDGIHKEAEDRQRMINGLVAQHPDVGVKTIADMATTEVMPFGRNIIAAKIANKMNELEGKTTSLGAWVKNFLLPGSTEADLQKKLLEVPVEQRGPITQKLIEAIKESASVFPSENYYAQYQQAMSLLNSPQHTNTEIWVQNIATLLDAYWIKSEVSALKSIGKGAATAESEFSQYSYNGNARRPGSANPGVEDVPFEEVHKADWELVNDPTNPMQIGKPKDRIGNSPAPKALPAPVDKKADVAKRIELNSVMRRENPVTPYSLVEQVNPAQARAMNEAIRQGTDETAEALTGVSREQALINNTYPQVGTESGAVLSKVNQDLHPVVTNTGALRYTEQEYNTAVEGIKKDFRDATGMEINDAMTTYREDGDHIIIDAHYAPRGGSWTTPESARAQAEYALRGYGVKEDEIIVMKRDGMDYVPVTGKETGNGDYIVKVRAKLPITDDDIQSWNPLSVKRNWADHIAATGSDRKGSVAGWMMDPSSMIHETITSSFSVAKDQSITIENMLLKPIKEFRSIVEGLPKERKVMMNDYIREANENQIPFDKFDLYARGFDEKEIDALKKWRDIWDNHYYLENYDLVRTLRSQGYELFENNKHRLFGKKISKNQNIRDVYDPSADAVRTIPKDELDALYNQNGSLYKLRRPIEINGVSVDHVMIRNTPLEYMRAIRETDPILNYRHGYYTKHYEKGAKFVDEVKLDAAGKEVRTTVAVAGNTKDAEMFRAAQEQATGNKHIIREDARGYAKDGDAYWDVNQVSGRIAQRFRGKPLVETTGINTLGDGSFVINPMESAVRAAKSLSGRTLGRTPLETAKRRFVEQYGELIKETNEFGEKVFPSSRTALVDENNSASKRIADARTVYGYIRNMENGYINTADQLFQGGMRAIESMLAKYELSDVEVVARKMGQVSPTHAAKATVFQSYIGASLPIRQWLVQGHQATRMLAYNPAGIAGMGERISGYLGYTAGIAPKTKEVKDFVKFVEESGMVAGVDRNSLVRGLGLDMADSSSQIKRGIGAILSIPQKAGFDVGEKINQLGHLAAVHEKWARNGADLSNKTVRDRAFAEARALGYDLNEASELHYTQASVAAMLQFLQMPHKAALQLTNRKLAPADRYRLAAFDMLMFGAKGSVLGSLGYLVWSAVDGNSGDILPDNQDQRDKIQYGTETWATNWLLTQMDDSGQKTRVDFSALAPFDLDGWARMYHAFMEQGTLAMIAASPVGQMWAINGVNGSRRNGRIPQAIITMGRFFNVLEEFDPQNPTKFTDVLNDVAKISSAWSAYNQAKIMLETRKKIDSIGTITDENVTLPEIWMQAGGFGKLSTKELYDISSKIDKDTKKHKDDVLARYRDIVTYYTNETNKPNADIEHITKVSSMLMRTFDNPKDQQIVMKQWEQDMQGKDVQLLKKIIELSGIPGSDKYMDDIRMMNIDEQQKQQIIERIKTTREIAARVADQNKRLGN